MTKFKVQFDGGEEIAHEESSFPSDAALVAATLLKLMGVHMCSVVDADGLCTRWRVHRFEGAYVRPES